MMLHVYHLFARLAPDSERGDAVEARSSKIICSTSGRNRMVRLIGKMNDDGCK